MTLQSKTKAQLLEMLESQGIGAKASMKKAELIALLEADAAEPAPAPAPAPAAAPAAAHAPSPASDTATQPPAQDTAQTTAAQAEAPSAWPAVALVVGGFAVLAVLGAILFG
jgi:hypothetical protein